MRRRGRGPHGHDPPAGGAGADDHRPRPAVRVQERRRVTRRRRGSRACSARLVRSDRDMTGRTALRREKADVPIAGGSCLKRAATRGSPSGCAPSSARAGATPRTDRRPSSSPAPRAGARWRSHASPARRPRRRSASTASSTSTFEWDLPASYRASDPAVSVDDLDEVVRNGDRRLPAATSTSPRAGAAPARPSDDDALEPRLELQEWDAPPSTTTSWHVSYKPTGRCRTARRSSAGPGSSPTARR